MAESFLVIDEHGELYSPSIEHRITDIDLAQLLLRNLKLTEDFKLETTDDDTTYLVESFDHPLIAYSLKVSDSKFYIEAQYQLIFEVNPHKFSLDPWDKLCGLTLSGAPFKLTDQAQKKLFDSCDEFDDDSFTLNEIKVPTPFYYYKVPGLDTAQFWQDVYHTEGTPGWDLQKPAEALADMFPRIKLPKCRILVLGCGEGHDAALFAQAGHVVTAVDFSEEGLSRGKKLYGHLSNLTFVKENIFNLPHEWNFSFDVIVEHTLFCAIPPEKRKDLVLIWKRLLHEEGQLMGVFFSMLKRAGPPYGSSEWEIRELLKTHFQFLFWGRWRNSLPRRQGKELFVLAKKR